MLEGEATTIPQRAQFNAQITIVVPTGESFEIIDLIYPIQSNQNYTGTQPTEWNQYSSFISPGGDPEHDFHPIAPKLAPSSFYNNINTGDEIILFACKIGEGDEYNPKYRFF